MSAPRTGRFVVVLLLAGFLGLAAAQDRNSIEGLKSRSKAGDKAAMRQLAEMYYLGRGGVERNFSEAAVWYEKLAKQGDARAQTSLGLMYARGYGVPQSIEAAHRWWSFAAAQNDPGAQYNLGVIYSRGEGIAADPARAVHWFDQAAQRGHIQAQRNLGMLYHEGKGTAPDPLRAYFWVKVAALQGDDVSQEALKVIGKNMTADQLRQSNAEADEWIRKMKKVAGP